MPAITMSPLGDLEDPKIKALARRALASLKLEAEKAFAHAADPAHFAMPAQADATEHLFLARLRTLPPEKQQAAATRALASVRASAAVRKRLYGDLASVDLARAEPLAQQFRQLALPEALKMPAAHVASLDLVGGHLLVVPGKRTMLDGEPAERGATTDKLELRIHKVRCIDETNPEAFGDDEIALGGLSVDESGDTQKIGQFMVGSSFDDGEQKVYSPPRRFTWFNLREGTTFPKTYAVTLVLAEKDMGGLADFLDKLWGKVKGRLIELITASLGAAVGAAIGSTIPGLGTIIGAAVGWVLGALWNWLMQWIGDDVFKPFTVTVNIPSLGARWAGGATDSPEGTITWTGYGGKYRLWFDWRLFA